MVDCGLNLKVGSILHIDLLTGDDYDSHAISLIGYVPQRSILVTLPYKDGEPLSFSLGDEYIVRFAEDDAVCLFKARVLEVCETPYPYLRLDYPEDVRRTMARAVPRVPIDAMVIFLASEDSDEGEPTAMVDMSLSGAKLVSERKLGEVNDKFSIKLAGDTALGRERICLPCRIRYVRQDPRTTAGRQCVFEHGVEFTGMEPAAEVFVQRFIYRNIARRRQQDRRPA